jgi:hypothetical protein
LIITSITGIEINQNHLKFPQCLIRNYSLLIYNGALSNTLWENENERQKTEQVPIPLSRVAGSCFEAKKMKKIFLLAWTSEIIQLIRFENHMDGP